MLVDPRNKIERYFLRVDDLGNRFYVLTSWILKGKKERSTQLSERLYLQNPIQRVESLRLMISETTKRQVQMIRHSVEIRKQKAAGILGRLGSLSPLSVLERGYSITRKLPSLKILRDSALVKVGDKVEVKLHRGTLLCDVEKAEIS
jgi:exodeoxyribonuclease VII large subunit